MKRLAFKTLVIIIFKIILKLNHYKEVKSLKFAKGVINGQKKNKQSIILLNKKWCVKDVNFHFAKIVAIKYNQNSVNYVSKVICINIKEIIINLIIINSRYSIKINSDIVTIINLKAFIHYLFLYTFN